PVLARRAVIRQRRLALAPGARQQGEPQEPDASHHPFGIALAAPGSIGWTVAQSVEAARATPSRVSTLPWTPESWRAKVDAQAIAYDDDAALDAACKRLRELPPLVTSWEVARLRALLAEAQQGKRFLLQGGDCAETLADCRSSI